MNITPRSTCALDGNHNPSCTPLKAVVTIYQDPYKSSRSESSTQQKRKTCLFTLPPYRHCFNTHNGVRKIKASVAPVVHKVTRRTKAWGLRLQARQAREGATQCLFRLVLASPPRSAPHEWVAAGLAGVRATATPSGFLGSGTRSPACQTQLFLLLVAAGGGLERDPFPSSATQMEGMCGSVTQPRPTLRPRGLQPARLPCLWDFPGKILQWVAISSSM